MTTRRRFLGWSVCGLSVAPLAFGASDFWNKKDPDSWSGDEIQQLLNRSPWAKSVNVVLLAPNPDRYGNDTGPVPDPAGINGGGIGNGVNGTMGPRGLGGGGLNGMGADRRGARPTPTDASTAIVRWESATPMMAAIRGRIPASFAGRYVIGLTSFPMIGRHDDMVDTLKSSATLEAKGRNPVQPGVVELTKDKSEVLFGFSKELFPLTAADKEVTFALDTGQVSLRAKFETKEMMYHGRLAV